MAELECGPYSFRLEVEKVLGDIGDRSLAGLRYVVKLGFRNAKDLCAAGFAGEDPSKIRSDGTGVTDEAPDGLFRALVDALCEARNTWHCTRDGRLSVGVYPLRPRSDKGYGWHCRGCEPMDFLGDPENVFQLIACVNPFAPNTSGIPYNGGVAVVMPLYRSQIEDFASAFLEEIREAPRSTAFQRYPNPRLLLRWMPDSASEP